MKKFCNFIVLSVIILCFLTQTTAHNQYSEFPENKIIQPATQLSELRANTNSLSAEYFGYEFFSYGQTKSGTVQEQLEAIECYDYPADYTKALYVEQGQRSTIFGFKISGWASTAQIPQYSSITGIRLKLGIWTVSVTHPQTGISDLRAKISIYRVGSAKEYELVIYPGSVPERLFDETIIFNSDQLIADLNNGYSINWIEISAYTTYIPWNRDKLYLDKLLVDYLYRPPQPPSAPVLTLQSNQYESNVQLSWTAPNSDAPITTFNVYRNGSLLATTTSLTYIDPSLPLGQKFNYRISAVSNIGESPKSNEVSVFVCNLPSAPQFSIIQNGSGIVLNWLAPNNGGSAIKEFRIYRAINGSNFVLKTSLNPVLNYTDTDILPSSNYSYRITAINDRGESGYNQQSIISAPFSVAIQILSPYWISEFQQYTTTDSITVALDFGLDYYNTTTTSISAIIINGSVVSRPTIVNSTRVTVRIPLPTAGFYLFQFEIWAYGQKISRELEINKVDSINGIVRFVPEPIAFESINIVPEQTLKMKLESNYQYSNILRDESYLRLERNQMEIDLLNTLLDRTGSINIELDLSPYIESTGRYSISVFLKFVGGFYFVDYREFFVDSDPPVVVNGQFDLNTTELVFEITEEFPRSLELRFSANTRELVIPLDTKKQYGYYSGFKNFRYTVRLNESLLEYSDVTIVCIDYSNRSAEYRVQLPNNEPTETVVNMPPELIKIGSIVAGLAALLSVVQSKIKNKKIIEKIESARNITESTNQFISTIPIPPAQVHSTQIVAPTALRLSDEEILAKQPERFGPIEYIVGAYLIAPTVSFDRVREIYQNAIQIAIERKYTPVKFWLFFMRIILKEEKKHEYKK